MTTTCIHGPVVVTAKCDCGDEFTGPGATFRANEHCEETGHGHDLYATSVTRVEKVQLTLVKTDA